MLQIYKNPSLQTFSAIIFITVVSFFIFSCSTSVLRVPAAFLPKKVYNPERSAKLKKAAENGVLFVINDHVFRDVEKTEVDSKCRVSNEPEWSDRLFTYLEVFSSKPNLYKKFHVIELRKSDKPGFRLQKDLDGLVYLSINYAKIESVEKINETTVLPCDDLNADYLNKNITQISLQWPGPSELTNFLMNEEDRPVVERFNFDTRFLYFLAEHGAVLKFNQDLGFDKTPDGKYILIETLAQLGDQVKLIQEKNKKPIPIKHIEHWMYEISQKSIQGSGLQLFQITRDSELGHGIKVDSDGELVRRTQGQYDPTYLYLGYRTVSGSLQIPTLSQMDSCLSELTQVMGLGFSSRKPASEDRASFLKPGYSCRQQNIDQ